MNIHKINANTDTEFLSENPTCRLAGTPIVPGDKVVICGNCAAVHLKDSWVSEHCGSACYNCRSTSTAANLPGRRTHTVNRRRHSLNTNRHNQSSTRRPVVTGRPPPINPEPPRYHTPPTRRTPDPTPGPFSGCLVVIIVFTSLLGITF